MLASQVGIAYATARFFFSQATKMKQWPSANDIVEAGLRIQPYVSVTPVMRSQSIDNLLGCSLFLKCENLQKVGAYKARGATNKLLQLMRDKPAIRGVCTHSSGNHGQALAYISNLLSVPCYVVMPQNSPEIKRIAVKGYRANIVESGNTQQQRQNMVKIVQDKHQLQFVHPYNDYQIITGAATACKQLVEQLREVKGMDYVLFPIGGGGLASGTLLAAQYFSPQTKRIGVEPELAKDAYLSLQQNRIHPQLPPKSIADGLRTSLGSLTFPVIRQLVEEIVLVSEKEIIDAMRLVFERMKLIIEPSSATVVAAVMKDRKRYQGKKVGVIISGGNVDFSDYFANLEKVWVQ